MKSRLLIISILVLLVLSGCSNKPSGDPKAVLDDYYKNLINGNFTASYEYLADANKNSFSKDKYILYLNTYRQLVELKSYIIANPTELVNVNINGIIYNNAIEYDVTQTIKDYYQNKEITNTFKKIVVNDNGKWKYYYDINIDESLASNYSNIGQMYLNGKGKDKDNIKAIQNFNEAIKADANCFEGYYGLSVGYNILGRYDESIENTNIIISNCSNKYLVSDAYNVLGNNYKSKGNYKEAISSFEKSLQNNPGNEYAKNNLAKLK